MAMEVDGKRTRGKRDGDMVMKRSSYESKEGGGQ
jgi:hypothetical protein